jgi:hypothetical protein
VSDGTNLVVARVGAFDNYEEDYRRLFAGTIRLVHSPEEHLRCSCLSGWYEIIRDMTPRSRLFLEPPSREQVETEFDWPVFIKGDRQTSRHQKAASIIENPTQFEAALATYRTDSILRWQPIVVREFVPLRSVEKVSHERIPASFEFRTFWWRGEFVGGGRYWWEGQRYDWNDAERRDALSLAERAAKLVSVPFLVVDLAMTTAGRWIVIECNDGQESGYAGVSPLGLWSSIVTIEKGRSSLS